MNKELKRLYICISDNQVVCFDTNMSAFHKQVTNLLGHTRSRYWMDNIFNSGYHFSLIITEKEYYFYKLL